jgi:hypothetical protein
MVFIEAALFVLSSGVLFNEKFRRNYFLVAVAGAIAIVSSYLLMQQLFGTSPNNVPSVPAASISKPEPFTTYQPADIPCAKESLAAGKPYVIGCMDINENERVCIQTPTELVDCN